MGEKQKRAVIIGASRVNKKVIKSANIGEDDFIICCDGGYKHCKKYGIKPNIVLGDFDSLNKSEVEKTVETLHLNPIKDDTDTIYAVRYAVSKGYKSMAFLGVMGGRPDHSFASIQTLMFVHSLGAKAIIFDNFTTAFLLINSKITIPPSKKSYLSVFSLSEQSLGVDIKNSKYELSNYTIQSEFPIGVSNEFLSEPVEISVKKGKLLIMITQKE